MRRRIQKALILLFAAVLVCCAGCQEAQTPSEKQSRLIAARNMELEKQLAARDKEIENLKARYAARLGLEQKKLETCKKETADCRERLKQDRSKDMDEMLIPTLNQLAQIRDENEKLKARIKELEGEAKSPE
ncbi:MAG: hypothetical protein ACYS8Z_24530 [Planctomycetota bacterium]|jgi:molecular chaperone GrpE (heat shock protein)